MAERKRGALSKSEKFYVDHKIKDLDVSQIANDLGRTVAQIRKYINEQSEQKKNELTKRENEQKRQRSQYEKIMGLDNPDRVEGVTIMHQGASEFGDVLKEEKKQNPIEAKYGQHIHKIK